MLKKYQNLLCNAQDWYHTARKEIKLASNIKINNKLLAQELEEACEKGNGVLTYAEYLTIDQFGENGYYAKSNSHGKTDVEKRWSVALAHYCNELGYDTIIEFGCGTGELGANTAKAYKKQTEKKLRWFGVEIDKGIHKKIFSTFRYYNVQDCVERIAATIDEIPKQNNALIVFPYSLDNIPPHVFLNTKSNTSYPNGLLGIIVKNGMLSETILSPETLQKKGIALANGLFIQNSYKCKLKSWKLRRGQRAYIPTESFLTLYQYAKKFNKKTALVIIDEFDTEPWFFNLGNIGTPRSLYESNLLCYDKKRYYRESGKHNLYYPVYKDSLLKFLNAIGFQSIEHEIEQKKSAQLEKKKWIPMLDNYFTYVFFAKDFTEKKIDALPITFTPQRII